MWNSWKIAILAIGILSGSIWIGPRLTGIALFVIGRDERRREREADTWVDDPRKSRIENWMEKRRQRFSPKRGIEFFFYGLVAFSIVVGIGALSGEVASISRAVIFVVVVSALAGLIGMFTEKVPL